MAEESPGSYQRRVVDDDLDELFPSLAAILLDGPKGVGKTATALRRAATVRRLDEPNQRGIVDADPFASTRGARPILIDEWQRSPAVWDAVRRAVDDDRRGGQFLLTGSAPAPTAVTHSGAGRIAILRMRPFTLPERRVASPTVSLRALLTGAAPTIGGTSGLDVESYTNEIVASGLPAISQLAPRPRQVQLDGYLAHIVDRDLPELGLAVRHPQGVTGWLRAYAAATSTTATYEKIRDAATSGLADKPARGTTRPYIELLTRLRILDPVPAWLPGHNHLSRLTQGDKHHLADPGLAARLVAVGVEALLDGSAGTPMVPRDGTFLGALFESLITMSVRTFAQASDANVFHLRTQDSRHEVDLIVERPDRRVIAIEVKLSGIVDDADVKHLRWLKDRIGDQLVDSLVITTGPEAYRRRDGIAVVPLGLLGP